MSRERFRLHRAQARLVMRASGGLDIRVFDAYSGTTNSLALGLADVVQNYIGGIRLETVFIDEGFGSLDAEAIAAAH